MTTGRDSDLRRERERRGMRRALLIVNRKPGHRDQGADQQALET